jgi:hypothetical protein
MNVIDTVNQSRAVTSFCPSMFKHNQVVKSEEVKQIDVITPNDTGDKHSPLAPLNLDIAIEEGHDNPQLPNILEPRAGTRAEAGAETGVRSGAAFIDSKREAPTSRIVHKSSLKSLPDVHTPEMHKQSNKVNFEMDLKEMRQAHKNRLTNTTKKSTKKSNKKSTLLKTIEHLPKSKAMSRKGSAKDHKPPPIEFKAKKSSSKESKKPVNIEFVKVSTPKFKGPIDNLLSKMEKLMSQTMTNEDLAKISTD